MNLIQYTELAVCVMRLKDRRVLITGGAQGIGYGIAQRFLEEGAKVFLTDRLDEKLQETVQHFRQTYEHVAAAVCDVSKEDQLERVAELAWQQWDGIDVLVNNAGIATREPFLDITLQYWEHLMNVNLKSTFYLSQLISRRMVAGNIPGSIVNMASKNGLSGSSMLAHYNASKGGVVLLTESMAVDLAPYHIRVNAVAPGFIDTPLDRELKKKEKTPLVLTNRTPMGRLGTVEEVAHAFLFLASEEASYITGTTIVVDGGHLANGGEI